MGLEQAKPAWRIVANDKDVTGAVESRFMSLRITDEAGFQSDTLEVQLADGDPDNYITKPARGAELEVWMGYQGSLTRMGLYVFDDWGAGGWPGYVTLRCRAAVYDVTPKGKSNLQTQKKRSWPRGTKLADMVAKIAKEHGLEPAVSQSLRQVALPHLDQTHESDVSFLVRVTKQYDAVVKPAGGKLLVVKRGESKTISGLDLPAVTIHASQCSRFEASESSRESPGTVVAHWNDKKGGRIRQVKVGDGEPVRQLRHPHPSEGAAIIAAQAELDKRKRGMNKLSLTTVGDTRLAAEGVLVLQGFRPELNRGWLITRVEHALSANGYTCDVEAEEPGAQDDDG